jgi:nucleoside-diphosphate-sugar epimerase
MQRTALVTGGAGFIGSHLVGRLAREGWRVRVLDDLSTGFRHNLSHVADSIELMTEDVRDAAACREACKGVDSVFHLAAIASVAGSVADPASSHDVTLTGTLNLLMAARDAGVRRFVFSSSAAVYGNAETVPTTEDQPIDPQSPYATAKAAGELYCRNFWGLFELETVILRYFNVFGPRQSANSGYAAVIPCFVKAALTGKQPVIYGDGLQTRDFVHVSNVVDANIRAAQAAGVGGQTFNIGGGEQVTLRVLLCELEQITGMDLTPEFLPGRAGEVRHSRADIGRAMAGLGYQPSVTLREGLQETYLHAEAAKAGAV